MKYYLGIDIGSVSVDTAILDENKNVIDTRYLRTKGQPVQTTLFILKVLYDSYPNISKIAVTGTGGKLISRLTNALFVNEVQAQARGTRLLNKNIKTIIEVGGEDSKLIQLNDDGTIADFSMNTICAAGTGSFLDQQASRLNVRIEDEFGELAMKSKNPPRIAGRCSVFAKSDMIHLQQEGVPDYDIIAGLCYALARSFVSNIVKGRVLEKPIAFNGGVAANKGMIRAFKDILNLKDDEFIVLKHHACIGAIGAALESINKKISIKNPIADIEEYLATHKRANGSLEPLMMSEVLDLEVRCKAPKFKDGEKVDAYLGIDVGSLSTNVVVIDKNKRLLSRVYLRTAGRPIEAVKKGIKRVYEEIGKHVVIKGVCTTGSGRYLTGKLVGADIVKNEITAQARGTLSVDPKVDTIFEIGGQDSKFISLKDGIVVDFAMNKVCAAGTGSFLEEQAEKLDVNIVNEFGDKALKSRCPTALGERCTVFMESDLNAHKQSGADKNDLIAGLCYSIALNYINRVVAGKKIGDNIYFQGAVAFNKGVVAAFRKLTGKDVKVTPNNDVTGAIGAAIIALENQKEKSNFRGFKEIIDLNYEQKTFECKGCPNRCEIKSVKFGDEKPVFYGSRCEKYDVDRKDKLTKLPDLFKERMDMLLRPYKENVSRDLPSIGIPLATNMFEFYPFWNAFFTELGFSVVHSTLTNKEIINEGLSNSAAETCFPIKVAHGHVLDLVKRGVDYIFTPVMINSEHSERQINSYFCPFTQTFPYMINSAIEEKLNGKKLLQPVIHFQYGKSVLEKDLIKFGLELGKKPKEIKRALESAIRFQDRFYKDMRKRGKEILEQLGNNKRALVIVSRPYNGCDPGLNLDLPKKLRNMGVLPIPMDFLPIDIDRISEDFSEMYWKYGQKILAIADFIKEKDNLFAIYVTNFGCGPDSFILQFFERKIGHKPHLVLEVDEHSADAGIITRCEAFLDSIDSLSEVNIKEIRVSKVLPLSKISKKRKIYIPYMGDYSYALKTSLKLLGYKSEVIPLADEKSLEIGRKYTLGKECLPMIITTGDMVKIVTSKDFRRDESAFFIGTASGPCRFGQYAKMQRIILDELGFKDVPIVTLTADDSYGGMGLKFLRLTWNLLVAIDLLGKTLRKIRPYEIRKGETDKLYSECLEELQSVSNVDDVRKILKLAAEKFKKIPTKNVRKPLIGMVGEIYVRNHPFSNNDIIRKIEGLGGEVWLTPVTEWFFYVNFVTEIKSAMERKYGNVLKMKAVQFLEKREEHKLFEIFKDILEGYEEPEIRENVNSALPYLTKYFFGEAILSVGKSVDFFKKGVDGIINTIPFTCMPGTIVTALIKKFRKEHDNIPVLTMFYDGCKQEQNEEIRLEAFMLQAREYMLRKKKVMVSQ